MKNAGKKFEKMEKRRMAQDAVCGECGTKRGKLYREHGKWYIRCRNCKEFIGDCPPREKEVIEAPKVDVTPQNKIGNKGIKDKIMKLWRK